VKKVFEPLLAMLPSRHAKTPFVMQMEAVECGAAALAMILGYHGRHIPLTELRVECGVSRDGSKASNILKAARRYGMTAKGYSKGMEALKTASMPCIVFWEFNHFLVVEGFDRGIFHVNDPAVGHRQIPEETFSAAFTGVVLTFEPAEGFERGGRQPSTLPFLRERVRGSERALLFACLCGLLGVFPGIVTAGLTRVMVDNVIAEGRFEILRPVLVGMIAVLAFQVLLTMVSNLFSRRFSMGLAAKMYAQFYRHILRLPYHFYTQRYVGDVVDRGRINDLMAGLIAGQISSTAIGLITMVLYGAVLMSYNMTLTLIGVGSTVLNFLFMRSVAAQRMEANIRIAKEQGKVQGATIAALQSIESLKASGQENAFFEKWAGYFTSSSNAQLQLTLDSRLFGILPTLTGSIISTITLLLGGYMVMNGEMTFGTLMAFNALMALFLAPMGALLGLSVQMQQLRGAVIRLEDVVGHPTVDDNRKARQAAHSAGQDPKADAPPLGEVDAPTSRGTLAKARLEGDVRLIDVNYGYNPLDQPLVQDFNLHIRPGERVALVGGSGSGKSTVGRIVAGLVEPWKGQVLFDGQARDGIDPILWSNSVAMIEQDILMFPGTIRENLSLWDETLPDKWLLEALEDADLLDFVMALPGGLQANVQEAGSNMSGGQRQRLEIARALARRPTFLIMDEATSALDTETEANITRNINRRGCSCLIVAHRLSTVRTCDRIVVLHKGKVREVGTHDELWQAQGAYAKLLKAH
jgi:ATP-binding cassette subfamily C protein